MSSQATSMEADKEGPSLETDEPPVKGVVAGLLQPVVLAWAVASSVIVAVAILFPLLYIRDQSQWNQQWQGACDERGHLLESGFGQSFKMVDVLARTMERFYIWPDPPQIDQEGFKEYLQGIIPGTFIGNCVVMRFITEEQRPEYEAKWGQLIHMVTNEPPPADPIHPITELVQEPSSEWIRGMAMDHVFEDVFTNDDIINAAKTGIVAVSPPALAAGDSLATKASQYIFVAAQPTYVKRMAANASPEERLASFAATFAVNFDAWSIVEGIANDLQGGKRLVLKLVDVTEERKPPLPLYIPALETGSARGNWTFADYGYKMPLRFGGTDRRYEIWCRPAPGNRFFPVRAVGFSAAMLLLGLSAAQVLWVYAKLISVSEARCRDALRLKDEMALAKKESDDHSAAKSAFVASVSHEIRTPMNGVLGMLGLLIDTTELTPIQEDYTRTALSSGRALLSLVNDILDLSKIESSCMELESIPFSPVDEMDVILSMFGERSRGKNLELSSLVQPGVPHMVMGDPDRFRQILINLIGNSLKFCNRGHILVRITAVPDDDALPETLRQFHAGQLAGGSHSSQADAQESNKNCHRGQTLSGFEVSDVDCCWPSIQAASIEDPTLADKQCLASSKLYLLVWVEDSGIGIADEAKDRIFKPFMQADKSTTRIYGGTGIGLNITKKLVELMSGQIDFTTHLNKGTTFRLHIPVQSCPLPIAPKRRSPARLLDHIPLPDHCPNLTGMRALCIDNNALRAEITCSYLRSIGLSTQALVVPFPSLNKSRRHPQKRCFPAYEDSTADSCAPPAQPPDIIFLELEPSAGEWGRNTSPLRCSEATGSGSEQSNKPPSQVCARQPSKLPASTNKVMELEQRLAWARGIAAAPGRRDERTEEEVPIVLLSNTQDPAAKVEAERVGFTGVVVKPLRKGTLTACLLGALGREKTSRLKQLMGEESQADRGGQSRVDSLVGMQILVVDDNAINRKVASKILEKYRFVATSAASGKDALKALEGCHGFNMVLTDIQMPEMDGYEMTRAIRVAEEEGRSMGPWYGQRHGVPIVAMTADVMKGVLERCVEIGMDGMIPKPIEGPRLLQVIEEALKLCND